VLSLGGIEVAEAHRDFPGRPIVVQYAPQVDLIARSVAVIAHAGLNTTMEALAAGVPIIAIPTNAGDQSGVAARIRYHGVGHVLNAKRLTSEHVHAAASEMLCDPGYGERARRMSEAIRKTGGAAEAARIIQSLS
jgi:UDP:flavonoid glycosyltransferase YjiC (YdhE family)